MLHVLSVLGSGVDWGYGRSTPQVARACFKPGAAGPRNHEFTLNQVVTLVFLIHVRAGFLVLRTSLETSEATPRKNSDRPRRSIATPQSESLHAAHSTTRSPPAGPQLRATQTPAQPRRQRLKHARPLTSTTKATRVPNSVGPDPFDFPQL